jgi:hypothetical protein
MDLYYDERDDAAHEARGSRVLYWLDDLGAKPLAEARPTDPGFLFAGARPIDDYARLVDRLPLVRDRAELTAEAAELRRVLGWDALVLARAWHDLAEAGRGVYGPVPQEVRVWVVDGRSFAWSFHHLHVVPGPAAFPPAPADVRALADLAGRVGSAFRSRLVAADFAREAGGGWLFVEAGPGSCAGTAHEGVFKAVAARLAGLEWAPPADRVGGLFADVA